MIRIFLVLIFFSLNSYAGDQVTVLVSVTGRSGFLFKQETSQRLIKNFKRHFQGDIEDLNIINNANQEDLHRELMNPENSALFWISHASSSDQETALQTENVIIDFKGNDIKDIFQKINPRLKFLAVLGCKTAPILDGLKSKGHFAHNKQLVIYAKNKKINGMKEIKKALNEFEKIDKASFDQCPKLEGHAITLTRTIGARPGKSLKVMNREKFLGLFPSGLPGEIQKLIVYVPKPSSVHDLKIQIEAEAVNNNLIEIVSETFLGRWKVFADINGKPIGLNQNIYRYSGAVDPLLFSESYFPFKCD